LLRLSSDGGGAAMVHGGISVASMYYFSIPFCFLFWGHWSSQARLLNFSFTLLASLMDVKLSTIRLSIINFPSLPQQHWLSLYSLPLHCRPASTPPTVIIIAITVIIIINIIIIVITFVIFVIHTLCGSIFLFT
jgi:hypothetical protein